jgi:Fic family protein
MKWVWQLSEWPKYSYDLKSFENQEDTYLFNIGKQQGYLEHLSVFDRDELKVQMLSDEALATSIIEGEILNRESVKSSVKRNLGLKEEYYRKSSPQEAGIAELLVDTFVNFQKPLDHSLLFEWHKMLMNGRRDIESIGMYRTHEAPMQIVSGNFSNPTLYYEAPPSKTVIYEMEQFIAWVTENLTNNQYPNLIFAAIAHLRFEQIHPFEDGNGRIGRALIEKILSLRFNLPLYNSLSKVINQDKKSYYNAIQKSNTTLDIQSYLEYFTDLLIKAQVFTIETIEFTLFKSKLFTKYQNEINPRQTKVILSIFDEGISGFKGGLSASNYKSITGAPNATVTRDLQELVELGIMSKSGVLKGTRYFINFPEN